MESCTLFELLTIPHTRMPETAVGRKILGGRRWSAVRQSAANALLQPFKPPERATANCSLLLRTPLLL